MRTLVITVPYRYDEPDTGLGAGPAALLRAGLLDRLMESGHEVRGPVESRLDPDHRLEGHTIANLGALGARTAELVASARRAGERTLVLAGDDTAAIGVVAGLQQAEGEAVPVGVVWLDAHGDFNTPETSYSGILAGMPLAIIAGLAEPQWRQSAGLAAPIPTERILLGGVRELDPEEERALRSTSVTIVACDEVRAGEPFAPKVERMAARCQAILLHLDVDVLDPHLVPSATTPVERGLELDEAVSALTTVLRTGKVAAVCVCSLNPGGGMRGQTSIETTLALLEKALPAWTSAPGLRVAS